jgi:phosphatidylglycerol---prolipoprotein diacylglyceryl transferase
VPIAVLTFEFDPLLRLSESFAVRWETVAIVAIVAAGLVVTGLIARREGLRPDDLLFIAVATVPGAVVGARLGYVLLHLDYYGANRTAIFDLGQGSLELGLAVVGGALSGSYVAGLLGTPLGHWMRTMALPLLLVLGAGKLAMVLGGTGQGQPADVPWATAYLGPGPWGSLAAIVPSHPAQAYEGLATLGLLLGLTVARAAGAFGVADGRLFLVAIGAWAVIRAVVSVTWRDPILAAGLNAAGLVAGAIAIGAGVAYIALARGRSRAGTAATAADGRDVTWADPEARPRF